MQLGAEAYTLSALGEQLQVTATVKDQSGTAMSQQDIVWSTDDPSVARISPSGTLTAVSNGRTSVIAASGALSAHATVEVSQVATQLTKVSGDGQTGVVMEAVAEPLVVQLRDAQGYVVPGRLGGARVNSVVTFVAKTGGGVLAEAEAPVGGDGTASDGWTLGTSAGTQIVTVGAR